jgi:HSP20 family protein
MTTVHVNNRPALKTWNGLVNELFNDLEKSLQPATAGNSRNIPSVNIIETTDGYHAELLAPGRKKENFSMEIKQNELTVSYHEEKAEQPTEWKQIRREFNLGNFKRSFVIDEKINTEQIEAKYEDGLLKIYLPKKAELQPVVKAIEIK